MPPPTTATAHGFTGCTSTLPTIADVDYSGAQTINELIQELHSRGVRLVLANVEQDVQRTRVYGLTALIGADAYFDTVAEVIEAYRHSGPTSV